MIDLTNVNDVKGLQSNVRSVFETPQGKEVMKFLEQFGGFYDFRESDPNQLLVLNGRRQVLGVLKNLLDLKPEEVVYLAKET